MDPFLRREQALLSWLARSVDRSSNLPVSNRPPKGSAPASITTHFADLPEPRVARTRRHELLDVITIAILAVICGARAMPERPECNAT